MSDDSTSSPIHGAATAGAALTAEPAAPPSFAARALRLLASEFSGLDLRLLLVRALVAPLPRPSFGRLRALLYRLGGLDIGPGSLILGPLDLSGQSKPRSKLHIAARCMINSPCFIELNDDVRIDEEVNIGHHVVLTTSNHLVGDSRRRAGLLTTAPIILEAGCWLGACVTVLPGVTVGRGAIVAAGAVVTRDVAPNTLVGGIPAMLIKELPLQHAARPLGSPGLTRGRRPP